MDRSALPWVRRVVTLTGESVRTVTARLVALAPYSRFGPESRYSGFWLEERSVEREERVGGGWWGKSGGGGGVGMEGGGGGEMWDMVKYES